MRARTTIDEPSDSPARGRARARWRRWLGAARGERERVPPRLGALVHNSFDVVAVIGADTTITYLSPSASRVLGWEPAALTGTKLADLVHPDDTLPLVTLVDEVVDGVRSDEPHVEARWRHKHGDWRHVQSVLSDLRDDPGVGGIVVNAHDVTAARQLERQLRHHALHDPLTDLPNRELFMDRVAHALARAHRGTSRSVVLFVDLDDFKATNDTMGHAAGDQLLEVAAERLAGCVRPGDTVARLHGDEFAILLEDVDDDGVIADISQRVLDVLRRPVGLEASEVVTHASVGVADDAGGMIDAEELLHNADLAMYMAKRGGKDRIARYEPYMHEAVVARLRLKADLEQAVARGQFAVVYQPVIALGDSGLVGVEALVRWHHPRRGIVMPADFIPLAEQTGLIVPMGRFVLREACGRVAAWQREHGFDPPLQLGVNVSARQLQEASFVDDVSEALATSGLAPTDLALEITETLLLVDLDETVTTLEELRRFGIRIAIDDFGAGYSSLQYLERLPVDVLKVDRSFVDRLTGAADESVMVRAMMQLGSELGLDLVAEGIEQAEQLAQLRTLGYTKGQGFIFAEPLDPDTMAARLGAARDHGAWVDSEASAPAGPASADDG